MDRVRYNRTKKRHRQQKKRKNGPRAGGVSMRRKAEGKRPSIFNIFGGR